MTGGKPAENTGVSQEGLNPSCDTPVFFPVHSKTFCVISPVV